MLTLMRIARLLKMKQAPLLRRGKGAVFAELLRGGDFFGVRNTGNSAVGHDDVFVAG